MAIEDVADFIDIFADESIANPFGVTKKYRVRLIVGYKIKGADLYFYRKYGGTKFVTEGEKNGLPNEMKTEFTDAARKTWEKINLQKEWIYEIPLYAYHFGADYEVDCDFVILGDWEQIGTMSVRCDKSFLMKGCNLPDGLKHLSSARIPRPSGRRTERI